MTPYAVLLVRPSDGDSVIRAVFHELSKEQHPDKTDGVPGPRWYAVVDAYMAVRDEARREEWKAAQRMLSGFCKACNGYGVQGSRVLGRKIRPCEACGGEGRTVK
jgi:DnaJ-class molecular chaperone